MAFGGIGLGLIYAQQLFWISNCGITIFIFNRNNLNRLIKNVNSVDVDEGNVPYYLKRD